MDFIGPVYIGNLVIIRASLNFVSRTSMEIGVRVEAECLRTGTHTHVASAYLTFVALGDDDKPKEIPRLIIEDEHEKRRFEEAKKRREIRMKEIKKHAHQREPCIVRPEKLN
jgi:acyl-CoA hydrolase